MSFTITSNHNTHFKLLKSLKISKYRKKEALFIAEGARFLNRGAKSLFFKASESHRYDTSSINSYIMDDKLFDEVTSQEQSQGVIALFEIKSSKTLKDNIVVIDRIQDPGNVGAVMRNMDAFGIQDLVVIEGSGDPYNPKSVRGSMGSILNMNIVKVSLEEAKDVLKDYHTFSTSCKQYDVSVDNICLKSRNAFVFGNESEGVSAELIDLANVKLQIELSDSVDSLNVAVASGIVLYSFKEKTKIG